MTDNCKELHFVKDDEAGDSDSGRGRHLSRTGDDKELRFVKDREARTVDSGQERQLSGAVEGEQLHFVKDEGFRTDLADETVDNLPRPKTLKFVKDRQRSRDLCR